MVNDSPGGHPRKNGHDNAARGHSIDQDPFENPPTLEDEARETLRRVEDLLRLSAEAQERGDLQIALEACDKAVELLPDHLLAHMRRGIVHLLNAAPALALRDFEAAMQIAPEDARPYNSCGLCYQQLGQDDRAIEQFTRALELSPSANTYNCRGWSHRRLGRHADAEADFQAAAALAK